MLNRFVEFLVLDIGKDHFFQVVPTLQMALAVEGNAVFTHHKIAKYGRAQ